MGVSHNPRRGFAETRSRPPDRPGTASPAQVSVRGPNLLRRRQGRRMISELKTLTLATPSLSMKLTQPRCFLHRQITVLSAGAR